MSLVALSGDAQVPATPGGLTALATSNTTVALDWSSSSDNEGVAAYTIFRRGIPIAIVNGTWTDYADTTRAGTTAAYTVDAVDASGNRSERSRAATVTTPSSGGVLIAAAGDIACDPTDAGFSGGNGTSTACPRRPRPT